MLFRSLKSGGTVVILMGTERTPDIAIQLLEWGCSPALPAAIIEKASCPEQRVWFGTLEQISSSETVTPSLLVFGNVVRFAKSLNQLG